jgi:nucleotide-binding universal stress UspA family protein
MNSSIVTILSVEKQEVATFFKEKFAYEKIQCFYSHEYERSSDSESPKKVIKLKVKSENTEKAVKVLMKIHSEYDIEKIQTGETIKDLQKIMVPIDLYDHALNAARYACSMAQKFNAEIKFLYIYQDPSANVRVKSTASLEDHTKFVSKQVMEQAQKNLIEFTERLNKLVPEDELKTIKHHFSLHKGETIQVINDVSDRYKPHLMILGTKAKKDKKNIYFGNEATSIIEHTQFPVMTIPEYCSVIKDQLNIMYATNFNDSDNTSLNTLLKVLKPFNTKIHCIHIDIEKDPVNKERINELNTMLKTNYSEEQIQCDLFDHKDLLLGFENFIKENDINLLSFSSQKRNIIYRIFNTNKLKKMVSAGKIPMLIFRV